VYQPQLPNDLIHRLWLLKQKMKRPMTELLREIVKAALDKIEQENNNDGN
jgi:predicted DNA-binding protein